MSDMSEDMSDQMPEYIEYNVNLCKSNQLSFFAGNIFETKCPTICQKACERM